VGRQSGPRMLAVKEHFANAHISEGRSKPRVHTRKEREQRPLALLLALTFLQPRAEGRKLSKHEKTSKDSWSTNLSKKLT